MADSLDYFCWGCFLRQTIFRAIDEAETPAEKKERIMIAYHDGHISARDAEDWIISQGLGDA